jgi:hypothetical protein
MKKQARYFVFAVLSVISISVWAQEKKTVEKAKATKPKVIPIPVYLGKSNIDGGTLTKQTFDSLLGQGLTSKDTTGKPYKVNGFTFTYGERNLYEDSVGNLMPLTDYLPEYCYGDTLTTFLLNNIRERSKGGDTVYIDNITLLSTEGNGAYGRSLRLVLTK